MSEANRCGECGAELTTDAPLGLCPGCLMKRGLETNTFASGGDRRGHPIARPPPRPSWRPISPIWRFWN